MKESSDYITINLGSEDVQPKNNISDIEAIVEVVRKIENEKIERKECPNFALFTDIIKEVRHRDGESIKSLLREAVEMCLLSWGRTINTVWFTVQQPEKE